MEARHARIKEMKAQRLERAAAKQREIPRQAPQTLVEIPDIDAEIKSHRTKIAQTLKAKNEEIEERERHSIKVRKIEQSLLERSMPKEKQSQTRFKANSHDESLKIRLQLLFKNQILRIERHTFNIWSSKCRFQSKAFERAKCFSDFRTKSLYFSLWKKRLRQIQNQKELDLLEFNLRRKKALEETSYSMYIEKALRKAFTKWRSRYRASIAQKIVEEQHSKRRLFFEGKITENKRSTSSATPKPPKASPKTAAKRKIKQITVDPKIEEMTKRMEETKLRRIEKAQKDAEIAQKQEEEKLKKKLENQRILKNKHREYLEREKMKRDEIRQRQIQYEKEIQRRKYCNSAAEEFRSKMLKYNHFVQWEKIKKIRKTFEITSVNHYNQNLLKKSLKGFQENIKMRNQEKEDKANKFYDDTLKLKCIIAWTKCVNETKNLQKQIIEKSEFYLKLSAFKKLVVKYRKSVNDKNTIAIQHANYTLMKRFFKKWPLGCAALIEEEQRENTRKELMKKALKYLEELDL